jgi:hypothetical protein
MLDAYTLVFGTMAIGGIAFLLIFFSALYRDIKANSKKPTYDPIPEDEVIYEPRDFSVEGVWKKIEKKREARQLSQPSQFDLITGKATSTPDLSSFEKMYKDKKKEMATLRLFNIETDRYMVNPTQAFLKFDPYKKDTCLAPCMSVCDGYTAEVWLTKVHTARTYRISKNHYRIDLNNSCIDDFSISCLLTHEMGHIRLHSIYGNPSDYLDELEESLSSFSDRQFKKEIEDLFDKYDKLLGVYEDWLINTQDEHAIRFTKEYGGFLYEPWFDIGDLQYLLREDIVELIERFYDRPIAIKMNEQIQGIMPYDESPTKKEEVAFLESLL